MNFRRLTATFGGSWRLPAAPSDRGGYWRLFATPGGSRRFLAPPRALKAIAPTRLEARGRQTGPDGYRPLSPRGAGQTCERREFKAIAPYRLHPGGGGRPAGLPQKYRISFETNMFPWGSCIYTKILQWPVGDFGILRAEGGFFLFFFRIFWNVRIFLILFYF